MTFRKKFKRTLNSDCASCSLLGKDAKIKIGYIKAAL
jgi:hypothetical protein